MIIEIPKELESTFIQFLDDIDFQYFEGDFNEKTAKLWDIFDKIYDNYEGKQTLRFRENKIKKEITIKIYE